MLTNMNIDFNTIDWVSLVKAYQPRPVLLSILSPEEQIDFAKKLVSSVSKLSKVPKDYCRDIVQLDVDKGEISSLDKAWIILHVNRIVRDLDFQ